MGLTSWLVAAASAAPTSSGREFPPRRSGDRERPAGGRRLADRSSPSDGPGRGGEERWEAAERRHRRRHTSGGGGKDRHADDAGGNGSGDGGNGGGGGGGEGKGGSGGRRAPDGRRLHHASSRGEDELDWAYDGGESGHGRRGRIHGGSAGGAGGGAGGGGGAPRRISGGGRVGGGQRGKARPRWATATAFGGRALMLLGYLGVALFVVRTVRQLGLPIPGGGGGDFREGTVRAGALDHVGGGGEAQGQAPPPAATAAMARAAAAATAAVAPPPRSLSGGGGLGGEDPEPDYPEGRGDGETGRSAAGGAPVAATLASGAAVAASRVSSAVAPSLAASVAVGAPPPAPPPAHPPLASDAAASLAAIISPSVVTYSGGRRGDGSERHCVTSPLKEKVCVHAPFCVRSAGLVFLATGTTCGAYVSRSTGRVMAPLGATCGSSIEAWWQREAELPEPEQKPASWLSTLAAEDKVAWWEGETVFLRLGPASRSVAHYATRILFLHHVLSNPTAYGAPPSGFSNVVIVALPELARKLRYRRSWHHGLLAAVVHPAVPAFRLRDVTAAVGAPAAGRATMRVFVSSGVEGLARGRQVPCFRRAVLPGQLDARFFVPDGDGPGVADPAAASEPAPPTAVDAPPWADVARFRLQLAGSVGGHAPPPLRRKLLYVTRAGQQRTFDASSEAAVGAALAEAAASAGWAYERVAMAAASFREQVEIAAGAGVMVGVHGAQLAASIFLPPGAVLVEIFPHHFSHRLYRGGCGSGLKYVSMALAAGEEWQGLARYGGDASECVARDTECRDHYRSDERPLVWGSADAAVLRERLALAFGHVVARTGSGG